MALRLLAALLFTLPTQTFTDVDSLTIDETISTTDATITRAPENEDFQNVRVYGCLDANCIHDFGNAQVGGKLSVTGNIYAPTSDLTINTITKNGNTVAWPTNPGSAGTFLENDGAGHLFYGTPAGAGNVSTALAFANNNRIVTTDTPSGAENIKQSTVTLDGSSNISGVNALTATTLNGTLNGNVGSKTTAAVVNATTAVENADSSSSPNTLVLRNGSNGFSANTINATQFVGPLSGNASTATFATTAGSAGSFTGSLIGDVIGTQGATNVISIGNNGMTSVNVIAGATLANQATDSPTNGAIVRRNGSGAFSATTINATQFNGHLTGNVTGNADTATSAVSSTTAQWFSQPLVGDVTGPQTATHVSFVGGVAASAVATGAILANAATENNTPFAIVKRDVNGNFTTNAITINETTFNATDAVTKQYVDTAVTSGIVPKTPVLVTDINNTFTAGLYTIDGVPLSPDDRVLLVGETNELYNGIWLAKSGPWSRPTDFLNGTQAGRAYVLTMSGLTLAGSSWLCSTPLAFIGTDTVSFVEFATPGSTTGANVGSGAGQVFRDKIGQTLNFRTLAANNFMNIATAGNVVTLAVTATSDNTPNTVVSRDALGNFIANNITSNLTGLASQNVPLAGGTMTGNLVMASQKEVRWAQDAGGANYVGFKAPSPVTPYSVMLPGSAPVAGQFLQALDSSSLTWTTAGSSPSATKSFYVALNGSDSNNGSILAPFRHVKYALIQANAVANTSNQVAIQIGAGEFFEDNTGGLRVLSDGISIVGTSLEATIITPLTVSDPLFTVTVANVEFTNLSLHANTGSPSLNAAISFVCDNLGSSRFTNLHVNGFQTGISASSTTGFPVLQLLNNNYTENQTSLAFTNVRAVAQSSDFRGSFASISNTGISTQGSLANVAVLNDYFTSFNTALLIDGGATQHVSATDVDSTINGVFCSGGSTCQLVGLSFTLNDVTSINVTSSGPTTKVYVEGCLFDCDSAADTHAGTALKVVNDAEMIANACTIEEAVVGIACGNTGNSATTTLHATGITIIDTTTAIQQKGLSAMRFVGGSADLSTLSIENSTNIDFAAFNTNDTEAHLALGQNADIANTLYQVLNGQPTMPELDYNPSYYGSKGTVYTNLNNNPTFNGVQSNLNDARYYAVTKDRTKETSLNLISDQSAVRGWTIAKKASQADLAFTFTNSDPTGLATRGPNSVINLNGFDNQVEFPTATNAPLPTNTVAKLVWATDTNLYRGAANILQTDDDIIVGGLTANRAVATDASKKLVSSATTDTELGFLSGVTSNVQTQINSKVAKAGDTMTGTLTHPAGSAANPAIQFTGSTNTGLSAATANKLSFDTNGGERMTIDAVGTVTITQFATAGVVHNITGGALTSSLIINADVDPAAAIVDTKLATIQTAGKVLDSATTATSNNVINTIVKRDTSGNFSAGMITASLTGMVTGTASFNVLKIGDTMTGTLTHPAGSAATPSIQFAGATNTGLSSLSTGTLAGLSFSTNGIQRMSITQTSTIFGLDQTNVTVTAATFVIGSLMANQSIQSVTMGVNTAITIGNNTSILAINPTVTGLTATLTFPTNPVTGQLLTILLTSANASTRSLTVTYPASVNNPVTPLSANGAPDMNSTTNGSSITYIYLPTGGATTNTWYRYSR